MKDLGIEILENIMYGYFEHIISTDFTIGSLYCHNPDFKAKVKFNVKLVDNDINNIPLYIYNTYNDGDHTYLTINCTTNTRTVDVNKPMYAMYDFATVEITLTNQADLDAIAGLLRINGKWNFTKEILLPQ